MVDFTVPYAAISRADTITLAQKKTLRKILEYAGSPQLNGDLYTNGNHLIVPGTNTDGIKGGDTASSDYMWEDKEGVIQLRGIGAGEPAWAQIGATNFYGYDWDLNDEAWIDYHVPHDYVPNTSVYFHTHWLTDTDSTADTVKWQFSVSYAKGFGQEAYDLSNPTVVTAEEASAGQYYHMVTETAAVDLGITEPDGVIKVVIKRIANGATDHTGNVFMNIADIHYQSTGLGTVNKAPGFYNT